MSIIAQRWNGTEWVNEALGGSGGGVSNHASLTNLEWTNGQHTGEVDKYAGFDSNGDPAYLEGGSGGSTPSDVAYDASSWNGNSEAATKNAIRDKVETMDTAIGLNTAKTTFDSAASTKVGHLSVSQAVDLDTMESNIATNNGKETNATHTGDVTGDEALTIAADAVDIAHLSASGTPSSSTFLRGDNTWSAPAGGSSKDYASFYLSTGGLTGASSTALTLVVNATSLNSDGAVFVLATNQVTVNKTADFEINMSCYFNNSSTSRTEYTIWLEKNTVEVPGTRAATYQRGYDSGDTAAMTIMLAVTTGDVFRLRVQRTDGGATTGYQDDNGTRFNFKEL